MGEMWNKGTTEELGHPVKALKVTDGNGFLGFERVSLNQTELGQKKISILFHAWIIRISVPTSIGDRPIGAGVAAATPDKERNLSTRNQKVMN